MSNASVSMSAPSFDLSLYIGTQRIENYLPKAWRDVSGASQGIKDKARAMAVRNYEAYNRYGSWKPILKADLKPTTKTFKVFTSNPKEFHYGTILGFDYGEVVIKPHHEKSKKAQSAKTPKTGGGGGSKKTFGPGKTSTGSLRNVIKHYKPLGHNGQLTFNPNWCYEMGSKGAHKKHAFNHRVEAEPLAVRGVDPVTLGNLDSSRILALTGHKSSKPGVDLAIRKAARLERNACRAANRAAFNLLPAKTVKRQLKTARKQAATWNVVKLINAATRKAQSFMTAAHNNFDVNGVSLVMSDTSVNKEEQTASMGDTSVDLHYLVQAMGAVHLNSMSNVDWNGNHENVFITICAGDYNPNTVVNFNYPLIKHKSVSQKMLWTHSVVEDYPRGLFGSPDFHMQGKSMAGSVPVGYIPMRTKAEYWDKEVFYPQWMDLVATNCVVPEYNAVTLQYQVCYNSYYHKAEVNEQGDFIEAFLSDYGTSKLPEIPGDITATRNALHAAMYTGEYDASALAASGNKVTIHQSTQQWILNNQFTPAEYPANVKVANGYFLVIGYVNKVDTQSIKLHQAKNKEAQHVRVLCDKVDIYGIRYEDLNNFVSSSLGIAIDISNHYWRMGFFPWAYKVLIKPVLAAPVVTTAEVVEQPSVPAVLALPITSTPIEPEATHVEVEVMPEETPAKLVVEPLANVGQEVVNYILHKPRTVKTRKCSEEQLIELIEAFAVGNKAYIAKVIKTIHPDATSNHINDVLGANAPKMCWYAVHSYYSLLNGSDTGTGATYDIQFIWEDLVRLVNCITTIMSKAGAKNTDTNLGIEHYLALRSDAANDYLYVHGDWYKFTVSSKELLVYDARGRMFNKTLVMRCTGHKKANYVLCSAFDNFMQFFYMGIVPMLTHQPTANLPKDMAANVRIILNGMVCMSKDEMNSQNGGEIHLQKISYHPVIWTEYPVHFNAEINCNGTKLKNYYLERANQLDTYEFDGQNKIASNYEMLGWIAAHMHQKEDLTIHFAKKVAMNGILSAINLASLAQHAPTIFAEMIKNLGWETCTIEMLQKIHVLVNTTKASKAGKRLTLFLTSAATESRTGQLVSAAHRLPGQTKPMCGIRKVCVLAPGLVMQPGMMTDILPEDIVCNIPFHKEEYLLAGHYSVNADTGHYFSFDVSDIEGIDDCEWTISQDEKGWTVLTPNKVLTLYGGEVICRTQPVNVLALDGRGFIQHANDVEGFLSCIKFIEEPDMAAGKKLRVEYTLTRDITEFKLRNTFVKANTVKTTSSLFFNNLNGNVGQECPTLVITQDAAKLDVITWVLSLIADTVGNPANLNTDNEVFMELWSLLDAYTKHTSIKWKLGDPVVTIPALIWAGYANELIAYFNEKFCKASWFVWPQSAPMAAMIYKLYVPKVEAGEWHWLTDAALEARIIADAPCSAEYTNIYMMSQDSVVTDETNILVFWFNDNQVVQVAQRTMTWQSQHGVKLTTVLAVELSSIVENVSDTTNMMMINLSALNKLIADKTRCNAIQHAAIDSVAKHDYRVAALTQMVGAGDFNLHKIVDISFSSIETGMMTMSAQGQAETMACIVDLLENAQARREGHFEAMCNALKDYCFKVTYKEGKAFTVWMPALLVFSKMKSASTQANNFVHCFYYDILLPTMQGAKVNVASASGCHGMMKSLLESEEFLSLFKGPKASQGKRISAPCIPIGELWVLKSNRVNSCYVSLLKNGYDLDRICSTTYDEDATDIIHYVCRQPIALGSILKIRVVEEKIENGKKVQYAYPIPSDTPEQAEHWATTPLAYHMTYVQLGQNADSVYASDVGDNDGDGIVMSMLMYLLLADVMTALVMEEIQRCYLGKGAYDATNDQYIGDHFNIKRWDDAMVLALDLKKAAKKALTTYQQCADDSADAVLILVNGVGVVYRIYATCDILIQILLAAVRNGEEIDSQYKMLLEHDALDLVLTITQIYEYCLGGFSKHAKSLLRGFLIPMMEGTMDSAALEADAHRDTESSLYKVVDGIGADVSRIKQIARMMSIINAIYRMKGDSKTTVNSISYCKDKPLSSFGDPLMAAYALDQFCRNKFTGYKGALPINTKASEKSKGIDRKGLECLLNLIEYCRKNNPAVIDDCLWLYAAEKTLAVLGLEMLSENATGSMWSPAKLQALAGFAKVECSGVQQKTKQTIYPIKIEDMPFMHMYLVDNYAGAEAYLPAYQAQSGYPAVELITPQQWLTLLNRISTDMNAKYYFVLDNGDNDGEQPSISPEPTPDDAIEAQAEVIEEHVTAQEPTVEETQVTPITKPAMHIYTDGSCKGNGQQGKSRGGWAYVVYQDGSEVHKESGHSCDTTNNRMEIMAVANAFMLASVNKDTFDITIYTDSQYVIGTLTQNWKTNKNQDLWDIVLPMYALLKDSVQLVHVKGHGDSVGNNRADELACLAAAPCPHCEDGVVVESATSIEPEVVTTLINDTVLAKAHMNGLNQDYIYLGRLSSTYPHNYGNPYSCEASAIKKGALPAPDNDTSVVYFEEWLYGKRDTEHGQEQRKWIIEQLQSGALKGKNIICYAHSGRCHGDILRDITDGVKPMPVFEIQQEAAPEFNEEQHILSNGRAINHRDVKVYFKLLQGKKVYTKIQSWNGTYPLDSGELTEHGFVGYNVKKGFIFASSIEVYNHLDLSKFKDLSYYQGETEYLSEEYLPIRRDFIIFSKWDNGSCIYYSALDQSTGEQFSLDYGGCLPEFGFYCYSTEHKFIFCSNAEMYDKLNLTELEGYTRYVGKFEESYQRNPNAPEDWKDYLATAKAGDMYVYHNEDGTVNHYELNGSDFDIDDQKLEDGIVWDFNGDAKESLERVFIVKGHPHNDHMADMFDSCINNETTLEEIFPIFIGEVKHIYPNQLQQQATVTTRKQGAVLVNEPGLFAQQGMLNYLPVEEFDSLLQTIVQTYEAGQKECFSRNGYNYSCCGQYYWVWDKGAAKYLTTQPDGSAIVPMPTQLADVSIRLVNAVLAVHGDKYTQLAAEYVPEVALINKYEASQTLNNHIDKSEEHTTAPIVSLSFGASGVFNIAGKDLLLDNGSVCLFWGEKRMAVHGYKGNTTEGTRYNVTIRMVKKPQQQEEPLVQESKVVNTFNFNNDGIDHINIYSAGKTELGKLLSNFAHTPVRLEEGDFASIEGYWHWLKSGGTNDQLRVLYGKQALTVGRASGRAGMHTDSEEFHNKIKAAIVKKLETYPQIWAALLKSTLPLTHYYVMGGQFKDAGHQWIVEYFEYLRRYGQEQLKAQQQLADSMPQEVDTPKTINWINSDLIITINEKGDHLRYELDGFNLSLSDRIDCDDDLGWFYFEYNYIGEEDLEIETLVFVVEGNEHCAEISNMSPDTMYKGQIVYITPNASPKVAEVPEPTVEVTPKVTEAEVINTPTTDDELTESDCIAKIQEVAKKRGKRVSAEQIQAILDSLNAEQKKVIYSFFLLQKDTFLTGEGGAGKTYTTCAIRSMLDLLGYPYLHVGTTGISVMNVDGDGTINSKLGLGLGMRIEVGTGRDAYTRGLNKGELYKVSYYKKLVRQCQSYLRSNWSGLVSQANGMPIVIFLEECSMLGSLLACAADEAIKKENIKVQFFMSGDLCQAGAVDDFPIYKNGVLEDDATTDQVTMTTIFNPERFQFINLLSNMRAKEDQEWIEALRALRLGVGSRDKSLPKVLRKIWNKSVEATKQGTMPTENVVHLCATNYTTQQINKVKSDELRLLKPESKTLKAYISTKHGVSKNWYKDLFNPIEEEMWMCVGMRVMLRANIKEDGALLAGNGSCGFVTGFKGKSVIVMFDNGVELEVKPQPLGAGGYINLGTYTQVPLHPCYAMTITKAQGLTLSGNVIIHPYIEYPDKKTGNIVVKPIFMQNLLYVACSRCPSSANLYFHAQIPDKDLFEDGEWDYTGAYNYLLKSYVCDHDAAKFVKEHILKQS